jgi:hypothetical protein
VSGLRVGILWRAEWDPVDWSRPVADSCRLQGVFAAFSALGVAAEPVVYSDEAVEQVRTQLLELDGVLVWVNPIEQGRDRTRLDPLLRDVAEAGVWVSAHPDVILKMGTKQVLVETRRMSWGTDTHLYRTAAEFRDQLPARLAGGGPLVLKQHRGMGGKGVWKVELTKPTSSPGEDTVVHVQHAARDSTPEEMQLGAFMRRCEPYFAGTGRMVEQPFQPRLAEGMIRVYLTHDKVVGFAHQQPRGLLPPTTHDDQPPAAAPSGFEKASAAAYRKLKKRMELEWLPELKQILDLDTHSLPVIWDADFLYGPKTAPDEDNYVLCEINVSSTFAFPEHAMPTVARAALDRIRAGKARSPR